MQLLGGLPRLRGVRSGCPKKGKCSEFNSGDDGNIKSRAWSFGNSQNYQKRWRTPSLWSRNPEAVSATNTWVNARSPISWHFFFLPFLSTFGMISSNFWELLEGFSPLFQTLLVGRMHKQSENGRFLPFIGQIGHKCTNSFLDTYIHQIPEKNCVQKQEKRHLLFLERGKTTLVLFLLILYTFFFRNRQKNVSINGRNKTSFVSPLSRQQKCHFSCF